jgi:hypothetical protein
LPISAVSSPSRPFSSDRRGKTRCLPVWVGESAASQTQLVVHTRLKRPRCLAQRVRKRRVRGLEDQGLGCDTSREVQALTKLLVIAAICIATLGVTAGATVGTTHAAPNTRFVQLTPHGRSAPAVATAVRRRTILYIKGRQRRFYISCYSPRRDPACDAGWVDPERADGRFTSTATPGSPDPRARRASIRGSGATRRSAAGSRSSSGHGGISNGGTAGRAGSGGPGGQHRPFCSQYAERLPIASQEKPRLSGAFRWWAVLGSNQ